MPVADGVTVGEVLCVWDSVCDRVGEDDIVIEGVCDPVVDCEGVDVTELDRDPEPVPDRDIDWLCD